MASQDTVNADLRTIHCSEAEPHACLGGRRCSLLKAASSARSCRLLRRCWKCGHAGGRSSILLTCPAEDPSTLSSTCHKCCRALP